MKLEVVSHVNGDDDLIEAWLIYYLRLGVSSFHLIVHGTPEENSRLYAIKTSYPVVIEETYEGQFNSEEKKRRLNSLLASKRGRWLLLVDSDEFVEFPYAIRTTIRMLSLVRRTALFAPMVQHLTPDGSLDTPERIADPFRTFPLCSVDLYQKMGVRAAIDKYPLFFCTGRTALQDGGNHSCPDGNVTTSFVQGVTHHFKFRKSVSRRLDARIHSTHPWRHESVGYQEYLETHANRLPIQGAFPYSRGELFRRGLLRRAALATGFRYLQRAAAAAWAPAVLKPRNGSSASEKR